MDANQPDSEDAARLKRFAELWLKNGTAAAAANILFPNDFAKSAAYAYHNTENPEVLAEMQRIRNVEPVAAILPTREELAHRLLELGDNKELSAATRLNCYRTFADVMGYVSKPGQPTNAGNPYVRNVMEVPVFENASEWERIGMARHAKLIAESNDTTH